jgi:hypothetical protein
LNFLRFFFPVATMAENLLGSITGMFGAMITVGVTLMTGHPMRLIKTLENFADALAEGCSIFLRPSLKTSLVMPLRRSATAESGHRLSSAEDS